MKKVLILYSVLFIFTLLVSCQSGLNTNLEESTTRTIYHAMGKTSVPSNPARVVTLTNEATEAALILQIQPIGAVKSWTGNPWYSHISNRMSGVIPVGTESTVDINQVASLKPDLILGSKNLDEAIYQKLSYIAPTILTETISGNIRANLNLYGQALNRSDYLNRELVNHQAYLSRAKNMAESLNIENKKVAIIGFFETETWLFLKSSFSGTILSEMGLTVLEYKKQSNNQEYVVISKSDFSEIMKQTDLLLYFAYDEKSKATETNWINDPIITNLTGTKVKKVYEVNPEVFYSANGALARNEVILAMESFFSNYRTT